VRERADVDTELKWPNDVLVGGRKVCGVLAEVPEPGALVVGIGLNVTTTAQELPHAQATSLRLEGARTTDRDTLLRAVLRSLKSVLADPEAARTAYRERCATVGRRVRVELPAGRAVEGLAEAVDDDGRIVVAGVPVRRRRRGAPATYVRVTRLVSSQVTEPSSAELSYAHSS
jgi:BirA family biotin operon repressor/biotin-[acetyl-CoA-carboxylase] ligase